MLGVVTRMHTVRIVSAVEFVVRQVARAEVVERLSDFADRGRRVAHLKV